MKDARIVLVAEWNGWCGACATERPLVLTRTGRRSLRAWLSASSAPEELLTLTCRLCGVGAVVPPEHEDPEVLLSEEPSRPSVDERAVAGAAGSSAPTADASHAVPPGSCGELTAEALESSAVDDGADVHAARRAVGAGLRALLAQRTAQESAPASRADVPAVAPLSACPVPTQRTSVESTGLSGFAALQLLAEGIDLVTPTQP